MQRCLLILIFSATLPLAVSAQQNIIFREKTSLILTAGQPLIISFTPAGTVNNLLVLVTDSAGRTLFLDNKYRFTGPYQERCNLAASGKGTYHLSIILDEKKDTREIIVK